MPGRTCGTGLQRAGLTNEPWELQGQQSIYPISQRPGQLAIRASKAVIESLPETATMRKTSLFWASAFSSAKSEHLLVAARFPPGFESLIWS